MHENHIAQSIFDIVQKKAKEKNAISVKSIDIVIEKDGHLENGNIKFLLKELSKKTLAENAEINVKYGESTYIENIEMEIN